MILRLAWQMGAAGPDAMLAAMPATQLAEWLAYMHLEPSGPLHADLQFGLLASLLFNSNRKKGASAKGPMDFFPHLRPPRGQAAQSREGQAGAMRAWAAVFGAHNEAVAQRQARKG